MALEHHTSPIGIERDVRAHTQEKSSTSFWTLGCWVKME